VRSGEEPDVVRALTSVHRCVTRRAVSSTKSLLS